MKLGLISKSLLSFFFNDFIISSTNANESSKSIGLESVGAFKAKFTALSITNIYKECVELLLALEKLPNPGLNRKSNTNPKINYCSNTNLKKKYKSFESNLENFTKFYCSLLDDIRTLIMFLRQNMSKLKKRKYQQNCKNINDLLITLNTNKTFLETGFDEIIAALNKANFDLAKFFNEDISESLPAIPNSNCFVSMNLLSNNFDGRALEFENNVLKAISEYKAIPSSVRDILNNTASNNDSSKKSNLEAAEKTFMHLVANVNRRNVSN